MSPLGEFPKTIRLRDLLMKVELTPKREFPRGCFDELHRSDPRVSFAKCLGLVGAIGMRHQHDIDIPPSSTEVLQLVRRDHVGAATNRLEISPDVVMQNTHPTLPSRNRNA